MNSNLLIDGLQVQTSRPGIQVSKRSLVGGVFTVEVVLLGGDEALGAASGLCRLADRAGPGGRGFVGASLRIARPVVGAADAVVRSWRKRERIISPPVQNI